MKEESRITSLYLHGFVEINTCANFYEAFFFEKSYGKLFQNSVNHK